MSLANWLMCSLGLLTGTLTVAAVLWNIRALHRGYTTVSECVHELGRVCPFVPAVVGCVFGFVIGALLAHWYWPCK